MPRRASRRNCSKLTNRSSSRSCAQSSRVPSTMSVVRRTRAASAPRRAASRRSGAGSDEAARRREPCSPSAPRPSSCPDRPSLVGRRRYGGRVARDQRACERTFRAGSGSHGESPAAACFHRAPRPRAHTAHTSVCRRVGAKLNPAAGPAPHAPPPAGPSRGTRAAAPRRPGTSQSTHSATSAARRSAAATGTCRPGFAWWSEWRCRVIERPVRTGVVAVPRVVRLTPLVQPVRAASAGAARSARCSSPSVR